MPLAQPRSSCAASLCVKLVLLAFVLQCAADANDNSSVSGVAIDYTVIVIAVFAFLLALILWYRWRVVRRRARAEPAAMALQSGAVLPTVRSPFHGLNARPLPSQQSYLGENIANQPIAVQREPPPAYHGKELAEGETIVHTAPPQEAETPPAYSTPALAPLAPAYMPDNTSRQASQVA